MKLSKRGKEKIENSSFKNKKIKCLNYRRIRHMSIYCFDLDNCKNTMQVTQSDTKYNEYKSKDYYEWK